MYKVIKWFGHRPGGGLRINWYDLKRDKLIKSCLEIVWNFGIFPVSFHLTFIILWASVIIWLIKEENLAFLFLSTAFPFLFQQAGKTFLNRNFRNTLSHFYHIIITYWRLFSDQVLVTFNIAHLPPFGPLLWVVKQTMSALCQLQPATAVGHKALALAKRRCSTRYETVRLNLRESNFSAIAWIISSASLARRPSIIWPWHWTNFPF